MVSSSSRSRTTPSSSSSDPINEGIQRQQQHPNLKQQQRRRVFTLQDVDVLDLVCHATWVFDISHKRFWYGNSTALEFWKASTFKDFINRSFDDMSDPIWKKNLDNLERLKRNEKWAESWTFYPNNGKPVSVSLKCSAIYIKLSNDVDSTEEETRSQSQDDNDNDGDDGDGHLCMFCEAIPAIEENEVSPDFLRGAAMLRYLPISVSQFDAHTGKLMHQNPEACSIFGSPNHTTIPPTSSSITTSTSTSTTSTLRTDTDTVACNSSANTKTLHRQVTLLQEDTHTTIMKQGDDDVITPSSSAKNSCYSSKSSSSSSSDTTSSASSFDATPTTATTTAPDVVMAVAKEEEETKISATSTSSPRADPVTTATRSTTTTMEEDHLDSDCGGGDDDDDYDYDDPSNHFLSRFVDKKLAYKLLQRIKAGEDVSVEALVHTKSKGPEWNAIHARLAMDAVSEDPVILYTARDISEIINAKKELQVNLERAEFFAIMAHEIRTPLFQVTGFIDLLDETELTKDQRDFIKLLRSAASSLMTVINDTLDYSKLEAGKMKLDLVPFEPKAVVDGSMAAITPSAEEKGIKLKIHFNRNCCSSNGSSGCIPVKLMGDPNRLRQVLLNLLQNAIKFTHKGSIEASVDLIHTASTANGNSDTCTNDNGSQQQQPEQQQQVVLRFSVKDTGIGISKDHMNNIFRKYTQAAASIATSYGGTGLGLSICKSLVECMGGEIGVDSVLGQGSTFWFQIPFDKVVVPNIISSSSSKGGIARIEESSCSTSDDHAMMIANNAAAVSTTPRLKVLVAEDNGVSRKMISKMLTSLGHDVTVVENGQEAVKEVELAASASAAATAAAGDGDGDCGRKQYDLILMDIQMPVMDGIDATKHIRSMGHTQIPIVGLTASVRRGDFQNIGLDDWIGKPVRLKELQKKLSGYFDDKGNYNPTDDDVGVMPSPTGMTRNRVTSKSKSSTADGVDAAASDGRPSSQISPPPAATSNLQPPPPKRRRVSIATETVLPSRSISTTTTTGGTANM